MSGTPTASNETANGTAVCQPTVNLSGCAPEMYYAVYVNNIVWLCVCALSAVVLVVTIIRRYFYLREKTLNTFWAMSLCSSFFIPAWCLYFSAFLDDSDSSHPRDHQLFLSITQWIGFFGPVFANVSALSAWFQVTSRRRLTTTSLRCVVADWPIHVLWIEYLTVGLTFCVLAGFPQYYPWAIRVLLCNLLLYVLISGAIVSIKVVQIRHTLSHLNQHSTAHPPGNNDSIEVVEPISEADTSAEVIKRLRRTKKTLTGFVLFVIGCSYVPVVVMVVLHCTFLDYIDNHAWSTIFVWSLYRWICMLNVIVVSIFFWFDTNYRLKQYNSASSKSSSHASTQSNSAPLYYSKTTEGSSWTSAGMTTGTTGNAPSYATKSTTYGDNTLN